MFGDYNAHYMPDDESSIGHGESISIRLMTSAEAATLNSRRSVSPPRVYNNLGREQSSKHSSKSSSKVLLSRAVSGNSLRKLNATQSTNTKKKEKLILELEEEVRKYHRRVINYTQSPEEMKQKIESL